MRDARRTFYLWAVLYALLSGLVAFAALHWLDRRLETPPFERFDHAVQYGVHAWSRPWLTHLMLALTFIGSPPAFTVSVLSVLIWLMRVGRRHAAALLGGSMAGAAILNGAFKLYFHRARPLLPWSYTHARTWSYPSGHALFSTVLYGTLAALAMHRTETRRNLAEILVPAIAMPLGIGLSRIYLGMHYPTDVLAGYLTGLLWLAAVLLTDRAWDKTHGSAESS